MMRLSMLLLALAWLLCNPLIASAQAADVTANLSASIVAIGEGFSVELTAEIDGDTRPVDPQLTVPANMSSTRPQITLGGFKLSWGTGRQTVMKRVYRARWHIVPGELGNFRISSPSVMINGIRMTASARLEVTVVKVGAKPKRRRRRRGGFGGLGSFFAPNFPLDLDDPFFDIDEDRPLTSLGRRLRLKKEPDPRYFVRLRADKATAVVGEQITISSWLYYRDSYSNATPGREPSFADFLRLPLDEPQSGRVATRVGRRTYYARKSSEVAIFPLRAGKLSTGRYLAHIEALHISTQPIARESNDVVIEVREPPRQGRPPGYHVGDVGRYKLAAQVAPRETVVGESVSVMVRLTGLGSLPSELKLPARTGVEWLKPEMRQELSVRRGRIGGWRSFGYVVSFREPGEVDLGSIELPYYDPDRKSYQVASVALGKVRVRPGASADSSADASAASAQEDEDPFASIGQPRPVLSAYEPAADDGFDPTLLWALVLTPPLGVVVSGLAVRAAGGLRRRHRRRKKDPAVLAKHALGDIKQAADPKDGAAAAERAVHLAIEAATSIKSRALLQGDLRERLAAAGVAEELIEELLELLDACSTVRFDPSLDEPAAHDIRDRARAVVKALARHESAS